MGASDMINNAAPFIAATFAVLRILGLFDIADPTAQTVMDLVSTGGSTAILVLVVYWFLTGKLRSSSVIEKQQANMTEAIQDMIVNKMADAITKAVEQGMMQAYYRQRKIEESEKASGNTPTRPRKSGGA